MKFWIPILSLYAHHQTTGDGYTKTATGELIYGQQSNFLFTLILEERCDGGDVLHPYWRADLIDPLTSVQGQEMEVVHPTKNKNKWIQKITK